MAQALLQTRCGIAKIRPRHVFGLVKAKLNGENAVCQSIIPTTNDGRGGLTFLETGILVGLLKAAEPRRIFEFGTFLGATSVTLAMNSPAAARVVTLDIPPDELAALERENAAPKCSAEEDSSLRDLSVQTGGIVIDNADAATRSKITRVLHNSLTLDIDRHGYRRQFDFIFIDGGHDYRSVRSDTEKALQMMRDERAIIAWHDFTQPLHPDVTRYLSEFSQSHRLMHVGDTTLAFYAPALEDTFAAY